MFSREALSIFLIFLQRSIKHAYSLPSHFRSLNSNFRDTFYILVLFRLSKLLLTQPLLYISQTTSSCQVQNPRTLAQSSVPSKRQAPEVNGTRSQSHPIPYRKLTFRRLPLRSNGSFKFSSGPLKSCNIKAQKSHVFPLQRIHCFACGRPNKIVTSWMILQKRPIVGLVNTLIICAASAAAS